VVRIKNKGGGHIVPAMLTVLKGLSIYLFQASYQ
jgi:hypothetical protein